MESKAAQKVCKENEKSSQAKKLSIATDKNKSGLYMILETLAEIRQKLLRDRCLDLYKTCAPCVASLSETRVAFMLLLRLANEEWFDAQVPAGKNGRRTLVTCISRAKNTSECSTRGEQRTMAYLGAVGQDPRE